MGHPAFVAVLNDKLKAALIWIKIPVCKWIWGWSHEAGPDCGFFFFKVDWWRAEKKSCHLNVRHEMQFIRSGAVTFQSLRTPFDPPGNRNYPNHHNHPFQYFPPRAQSLFFTAPFHLHRNFERILTWKKNNVYMQFFWTLQHCNVFWNNNKKK